MYQKRTADTLGSTRRILDAAAADIRAALLKRCLGSPSSITGPERPLRMAVFLALDDLDHAGPVSATVSASDFDARYTKLTAETARVALGVLSYAHQAITAAAVCRVPVRKHQQLHEGRALRASVHYSLDDLDRPGPLSVDECLFLPYDGIPPGLQPHNWHPEYRLRDRCPAPHPAARPQRRGLLDRMLGPR
ncbi:hypothetical protein [Streptomyces sp. WAC05858]|uniref:hypothetical protein n=1 Tax=Streptomyces TaxID=1883 RepID=UPI000F79B6D5|nr:hypothetical protein [Streptomyces sp. WAC05858]RSS33170.1 hypothetical protein EF902_44170 [Streptomyces sp. WAC05858]